MPKIPFKPAKVIVIYAHEDEALKNKLLKILKPLQQEGLIELHAWDEDAPSRADAKAEERIAEVNMLLILASSDLLASDALREVTASVMAKGGARVIPVIARRCGWTSAPFSKFQALPKDAKPITEHEDQDRVWDEVERNVRRCIDADLKK
jgi:hypothetical protein